MPQPISASSISRVSGTAAGTTVVSARDANLVRVIIPANKTGTASFYNTASATGTASTNFLFDLPNTVGTIPTSVEIGARCNRGITVVVGGTTDLNVVFD